MDFNPSTGLLKEVKTELTHKRKKDTQKRQRRQNEKKESLLDSNFTGTKISSIWRITDSKKNILRIQIYTVILGMLVGREGWAIDRV